MTTRIDLRKTLEAHFPHDGMNRDDVVRGLFIVMEAMVDRILELEAQLDRQTRKSAFELVLGPDSDSSSG